MCAVRWPFSLEKKHTHFIALTKRRHLGSTIKVHYGFEATKHSDIEYQSRL